MYSLNIAVFPQDQSVRPHRLRLLPERAHAHSQTVGPTEVPQTPDLHAHGSRWALCCHGGAPADGRGHPELHKDGGEEEEIRRRWTDGSVKSINCYESTAKATRDK